MVRLLCEQGEKTGDEVKQHVNHHSYNLPKWSNGACSDMYCKSSLVFLRGSCELLAAAELVLLGLLGSLQLSLGLLSWTLTLIIEEITVQCITQSAEL